MMMSMPAATERDVEDARRCDACEGTDGDVSAVAVARVGSWNAREGADSNETATASPRTDSEEKFMASNLMGNIPIDSSYVFTAEVDMEEMTRDEIERRDCSIAGTNLIAGTNSTLNFLRDRSPIRSPE